MLPTVTAADLDSLSQQAFLLAPADRWSLHPLMQHLVQQLAQQRGQTTAAHQKAIAYFLNNLKPSAATIDDCAEELAIFHHWCELQQYDITAGHPQGVPLQHPADCAIATNL